MDIKEFREIGYLHELNRLFLHPLGLALEIVINDDDSYALGGIWDYRDDVEGIAFSEDTLSIQKVNNIEEIIQDRYRSRLVNLGYWIQPVKNNE